MSGNLSYSLFDLLDLEHCLIYSRCVINICWITEGINEWVHGWIKNDTIILPEQFFIPLISTVVLLAIKVFKSGIQVLVFHNSFYCSLSPYTYTHVFKHWQRAQIILSIGGKNQPRVFVFTVNTPRAMLLLYIYWWNVEGAAADNLSLCFQITEICNHFRDTNSILFLFVLILHLNSTCSNVTVIWFSCQGEQWKSLDVGIKD